MVILLLIEEDSFAEGRFRYAYKGTRVDDHEKVVVKVFKEGCPMDVAELQPDLDVHKRAEELAKRWNRDVVPKTPAAEPIHYNEPQTAIHVHDHVHYCEGQWSFVEKFIQEPYEKFNSNGGRERRGHQNMGAFTHWTYEVTEHAYMVCDLQGAHVAKASPPYYRLTEPAVHSAGQEHKAALTDLGVVGMEMVLAGHACDSLCRALGLPELSLPRSLARRGFYTHFCSSDLTDEERSRASSGSSDLLSLDTLDDLVNSTIRLGL